MSGCNPSYHKAYENEDEIFLDFTIFIKSIMQFKKNHPECWKYLMKEHDNLKNKNIEL